MTKSIEIVRGSGNVFRDFGKANADAEHLKAMLAAQIINILDSRQLTVRAAAEETVTAAADYSRIRKAKLERFTSDRMMSVLGKLDQKVDVKIKISLKVTAPTATGAVMGRNSAKRTESYLKNPPHIGGFIRREIIEPIELTVTAAAQALGVSRPTLSNLVNGSAALSWEMAFRIEKAFGPKADHLMRMQFAYDEAQARAQQGSIKVNKIIRAPQP